MTNPSMDISMDIHIHGKPGIYTPLKFLECLSQSSANCISLNQSIDFLSDDSDVNDEPDTSGKNLCAVLPSGTVEYMDIYAM